MNLLMKKIATLILCLFSLEISADSFLVGHWRADEVSSDSSFRTYGEISLYEDGTFQGSVERQEKISNDRYRRIECVTLSGVWSVKNDIVTYENIIYSNGLSVSKIKDKIISYSKNLIKYKDLQDGGEHQRTRVTQRTHSCN